jgi:hypothetical protein
VADYKAGKVAALNSLKGQVMKLSKGKANPRGSWSAKFWSVSSQTCARYGRFLEYFWNANWSNTVLWPGDGSVVVHQRQ